MDKEVVKELIQDELTVENLTHYLHQILTDENRISQLKKDYARLKILLSQDGNASMKAAVSIFSFLKKKSLSD